MREAFDDKTTDELLEKINSLPQGYISMKTIKGKPYPYYQWSENGKIRSRYLKKDEYDKVAAQIKERKELQQRLKNQQDFCRYDRYRRRMLAQKVGIGIQYYDRLIEQNLFYVDKTELIRDWWKKQDEITLVTRPRRFGKTLNLSMLTCFFSNAYKDRSDLFENTAVWKYHDMRALQGTFPVISFSLSNVKFGNFEDSFRTICMSFAEVYRAAETVIEEGLSEGKINSCEYEAFHSNVKELFYGCNEALAAGCISFLSGLLKKCTGKGVLLFLDEYDTPLQEAWTYGYLPEMTMFMRNFFHTTLKGNSHLSRAFLTGITRISKESFFSDLNNLTVASVTSDLYSTYFGFTENEVIASLKEQDLIDRFDEVKRWYNGFSFGRHKDIYNPWSIINYLRFGKIEPYWVNSSSNTMISTLLRQASVSVKEKLRELIAGNSILVTVREDMVFSNLEDYEDALFSLMLSSGYLKMEKELEDGLYSLSVTNKEVLRMFEGMISDWVKMKGNSFNPFVSALLSHDLDSMNGYMERIALNIFSYFDAGNHTSEKGEPERFYHGFVLGLIVELKDRYQILSNRESGFGRYDVMLIPLRKTKNTEMDPGIIFEFKVFNPRKEKTLEDTVSTALKQIDDKKYAQTLIESGLIPQEIHKYGFAFHGKEVLIGDGCD